MPVFDLFLIFFRNISCNAKMDAVLPAFFNSSIDHDAGHPAFKTAFPRKLLNILKDLDKAILQQVFSLFVTTRILKADHEKLIRVFPVQLFLPFSILLFTKLYQFFQPHPKMMLIPEFLI